MGESTNFAPKRPLVVSLDGALVKTSALHEALVQVAAEAPVHAFRTALLALRDRASLRANVVSRALQNVDEMPIEQAVLEKIRSAKDGKGQVFLVTAQSRQVAEAFAASLNIFDGIFAAGDDASPDGHQRAERLVAAFGIGGFDYVGSNATDIPAWRSAHTAFVVRPTSGLVRRLGKELPSVVVLGPRASGLSPYLRSLRPHQWLKNVLIFLPAVAHHDFSPSTALNALLAFFSFTLCASGIYVLNDIVDLRHDRAHPEKRHRPIAAGTIPLSRAFLMGCLLMAASVALALLLPTSFGIVLAIYFLLSIVYSLYLKPKLMIDVVVLAALYGIRVLAGSAATDIALSRWLIGFSFFIFLSLALVKRTAELIALPSVERVKVKGRGYRSVDRESLIALMSCSGFIAVLIFALYINSPEVTLLYRNPDLLWGICVVLVYWLGRIYLMTARGDMNHDPVVFAATDRMSLASGGLVLGLLAFAV